MQGSRLDERRFSLPAGAEVPQDAREVALPPQGHLGGGHLQREEVAVLAPAQGLNVAFACQGLIARLERLKGTHDLVLVEFGDQGTQALADKFGSVVAEHPLGGGVDLLDHAAVGLDGDDAIAHRLEYGIDERQAVSEGPLGGIVLGDIAEDQHCPDNLAFMIPNGAAAIGDGDLGTIPGDQQGVVGQPLDSSVVKGRNDGG